jgi:hypothetical protein
MKPQSGRSQPLLFNPFTLWTDLALKTGELMIASAHAIEKKAKSTEFQEPAITPRFRPLVVKVLAPEASTRSKPNGRVNGKPRTKAKRRAKR